MAGPSPAMTKLLEGEMASSLPRWLAIGGAILIAAIAADSLVPVAWQVRARLTEHFLAYFAVTVVFCLAFQRPLAVAGDFWLR
jgi:hypothetical protein